MKERYLEVHEVDGVGLAADDDVLGIERGEDKRVDGGELGDVPSGAARREEAKAVRRLGVPHAHRTIAAARDDLNRWAKATHSESDLVVRVRVRWCVSC